MAVVQYNGVCAGTRNGIAGRTKRVEGPEPEPGRTIHRRARPLDLLRYVRADTFSARRVVPQKRALMTSSPVVNSEYDDQPLITRMSAAAERCWAATHTYGSLEEQR